MGPIARACAVAVATCVFVGSVIASMPDAAAAGSSVQVTDEANIGTCGHLAVQGSAVDSKGHLFAFFNSSAGDAYCVGEYQLDTDGRITSTIVNPNNNRYAQAPIVDGQHRHIHANSVSYDPLHHRLVVYDDNGYFVYFSTTGVPHFVGWSAAPQRGTLTTSICFHPSSGFMFFGGDILNTQGQVVDQTSFPASLSHPGLVNAGAACDDDSIFLFFSTAGRTSDPGKRWVVRYNWYGEQLGVINVSTTTVWAELESGFIYQGRLYVVYNANASTTSTKVQSYKQRVAKYAQVPIVVDMPTKTYVPPSEPVATPTPSAPPSAAVPTHDNGQGGFWGAVTAAATAVVTTSVLNLLT